MVLRPQRRTKIVRIVHTTLSHVSLRRVPELITRERVERVIMRPMRRLRRFGIRMPRTPWRALTLTRCENGLFGDDEATAIARQ